MNLRRSALLGDPVNVTIIDRLLANPRMTVADLARAIGMSAPATKERVSRLEDAAIFRGWRLELDPVQLGYPIAVMIRIRPMPGKLPDIIELARATPRVVECCRVTGEDCFIMRAHIESIDVLDSLLDPFLVYGQTTTSIIQSCPVPMRSLPLRR